MRRDIMTTRYDILIIGGGIAGMTAAIYASRSNLKTLVLEQEICGGLANQTYTIENFPSYISIGGMDLMENVKEQMTHCGAELIEVVEISKFEIQGKIKTVITDEGTFSARAIILAMGRKPIEIPVEADWDEHIHYCSLCDGNFYIDKDIVVVGGGNSAFDESLYLLGLGVNRITIIEALEQCAAAEGTIQKALDTGKIDIKTGTRLTDIDPGEGSAVLQVTDTQTGATENIIAAGMFVFIGQKPATLEFQEILNLDQYGYIKVTENMETNIPGVFAAGDIVAKRYRQLSTAAADGTIAALEAQRYLCS